MTAGERLDRIEHLTASLAEERRKDREEYKTAWRGTQRQIHEFATGMVNLRQHVGELAAETRLRIQEIGDRLDQQAIESRAADKALGDRISSLVSAMGQFIANK